MFDPAAAFFQNHFQTCAAWPKVARSLIRGNGLKQDMPIFRAHTCSTLTVPSDRRSRSSSKGSVGRLAGSSPSARELRRTSPTSPLASRFSSESRPSRGTASTGLDAFLSSDPLSRSPRPSSSASMGSLRSLSSQKSGNLSTSPSPASSPLSSHSPFAPPSPSSPHPRSLKGSKERELRATEKETAKDRNWEEKEGIKEGVGNVARGSIQLPHLKPKEFKDSKEDEKEAKESSGSVSQGPGLSSSGSGMLPRPKTVEARMEDRDRDRDREPLGFFGTPTPQEQLVNLFSGATRKVVPARPRPERLELGTMAMTSTMGMTPDTRPDAKVERSDICRPSSKYKYGKTSGRRPAAPNPTPAVSLKKIQRLEEGQKIFDLYYWEEILQQEGDGGKVVVCRPKAKDESETDDKKLKDASFRYVMKIKSKEALRQDMHEEQFVRAQLRLLNLKACPGVIQLQEILEDENFYYVVMDRATGGSFFSSLLEKYQDGTMPASAVCKVARDILETLRHLHKEGILHRDIKPDNMVMHSHIDATGEKLQKVTLIDFDHADAEFSGLGLTQVQHCFGTARFNAPEAFLGFYSAATDLYSVGVIVYLLLTGSMPYPSELFDCPTSPGSPSSPAANRRWMKQVVAQMEAHQIDWSHPTFTEIPESKDFCHHLLAFNMVDRSATADEALRHPWISSSLE